jgi:hypothetical protein
MGEFLGQADVLDQPRQARDDPRGLHPPHRFDRAMGS